MELFFFLKILVLVNELTKEKLAWLGIFAYYFTFDKIYKLVIRKYILNVKMTSNLYIKNVARPLQFLPILIIV